MTASVIQTLKWSEIDTAPCGPGVYAWYTRMEISSADIENTIKQIEEKKTKSIADARLEVEQALENFIFSPFRESPYQVALGGPLKAKFRGEVPHETSKSESLINRLAVQPERLRLIGAVLRVAAPAFTAPLYIGMSKNLQTRLRSHRAKIIEFAEHSDAAKGDENYDSGFARQVVTRGIDPTNLFVHVVEMNIGTNEKEYADIENLLNRINFPIFGRN